VRDRRDVALRGCMSEEYAMARLMTENGVELCLVELSITRARTREQPPPRHVLTELRIAAQEAALRRRRL
jgi:hypothetical protein